MTYLYEKGYKLADYHYKYSTEEGDLYDLIDDYEEVEDKLSPSERRGYLDYMAGKFKEKIRDTKMHLERLDNDLANIKVMCETAKEEETEWAREVINETEEN